MKKLSMAALSFLMMCSLAGCMGNDKKEEAEKDKTEEKTEQKDKEQGTIDDVLTYLKEEGQEIMNSEKLSSFDFAAKEGTSFQVNGESMYLYRVDNSDEKMKNLLETASKNNQVNANQNGETLVYGAKVNGDYLLVYNQKAENIDGLLKSFSNYSYQAKTEKE